LKDYKRAAQHSSQGIHVLGNKAGSQFGDVLGKRWRTSYTHQWENNNRRGDQEIHEYFPLVFFVYSHGYD